MLRTASYSGALLGPKTLVVLMSIKLALSQHVDWSNRKEQIECFLVIGQTFVSTEVILSPFGSRIRDPLNVQLLWECVFFVPFLCLPPTVSLAQLSISVLLLLDFVVSPPPCFSSLSLLSPPFFSSLYFLCLSHLTTYYEHLTFSGFVVSVLNF